MSTRGLDVSMRLRSGGKAQEEEEEVQLGGERPDAGRIVCTRRVQSNGTESPSRAATRQAPAAEAEEQQQQHLSAPQSDRRICHANPAQPVAKKAAAHATVAGRTRHAAAQPEGQQQQQQQQQQGRASAPKRSTRRRRNPACPEDAQEGPLMTLPGDVLDLVMSLLATKEGGSSVRATCRALRAAFDRHNTRLVLGECHGELPASFPARLLALLRDTPRLTTLTVSGYHPCLTWNRVQKAGGPPLLQRLEGLTFVQRLNVTDLAALASCTRLQRLCIRDLTQQQRTIDLHPLAARAGTLRRLEIPGCTMVRDFRPLAECTALQHLHLEQCDRLRDLVPLGACVRLQWLRVSGAFEVQDLSPLAACTQLQSLQTQFCGATDLGPLAALGDLRELSLRGCSRLSSLAPLASCAALQRLDLGSCQQLQDLGPLAACTGLQELDLRACIKVQDLRPLAACAALKTLSLEGCIKVQSLGPLAACLRPGGLDIRGCWGPAGRSPAAVLQRT